MRRWELWTDRGKTAWIFGDARIGSEKPDSVSEYTSPLEEHRFDFKKNPVGF